MEDTVLENSPSYDVPKAVEGAELSTGTIKWGNSYVPLRMSVVHEPAVGAGAGLAETGDPVAVPETVGRGAEEAVEVAGGLTTVLIVVGGATVLAGAEDAGAELAGAELAGAELAGVELAGAELAGAELAGAELTGAELAGVLLTGAELAGADVAGAELTGAVVEATVAEALLTGVVVVPTIEVSVEMREAEVELKVTEVAVLDGVLVAEVLLLEEETALAGQVRSNRGVSLKTLPTMPKLGLGVVG